jgi:hypothetical protein
MVGVRRFARLALQIAGIGIITLALAEATVRVSRHLFPSTVPSIIFYDRSYNRYRGQPGALNYGFRLNSAGFKDVEFQPVKEPGTQRVVAIGDSFAFGAVPYQYNYLTLVETYLEAEGLSAEVINMGIPGLAPQDYLAVLANEGLPLQPDLVLVSFFVGNDFDETMRLRTKLHQFSDFVALIKYVVDARISFEGRAYQGEPEYDDNAPYFRESTYIAVQSQRSWIYRRPPLYPHALRAAVDYLVRMKVLSAEAGAGFMVLVIPDETQVNTALQAQVLLALGLTAADVDFTQPNRFLADEFERYGIESVDPLDSFLARGREIPLYKPLDSHWNIAGNELAARLLTRPLAQRLRTAGGARDMP